MKAKVQIDNRSESDRKFDELWTKMTKNARLSPMQSRIVADYLRQIMNLRIHEIESAVDMAWLIALIESEKFGTDVKKGAVKLLRTQQYACDVRNEAYGHDIIDGNGWYNDYDGCGLQHLQMRLERHGVEYDTNL